MYLGLPASRLLPPSARALVVALAFAVAALLAAGIDRLVHWALRATGGAP
jgi:hypothetical protein